MASSHPRSVLGPTMYHLISINSGVVPGSHHEKQTLLSLGKAQEFSSPSQEPETESIQTLCHTTVLQDGRAEPPQVHPGRADGIAGARNWTRRLSQLPPPLAQHGGQREVTEHNHHTRFLKPSIGFRQISDLEPAPFSPFLPFPPRASCFLPLSLGVGYSLCLPYSSQQL